MIVFHLFYMGVFVCLYLSVLMQFWSFFMSVCVCLCLSVSVCVCLSVVCVCGTNHPSVCQDPSNPLLPKGFEKLTQVLINAHADVNICNKIGQTALHRASLRGNHAMVKQLIAAGCNLEMIDRCGRTAKDIAFDDELRSVMTPSGLKWEEIEEPPSWGTALSHEPLGEALVAKGEELDFTQEEWDALEPPVSGLSYGNYIAAGDKFFKPAMILPAPPPSEEEEE